jgi:DNA repair exonuclease SbcCD ATPase subunit
MTPLLHQLTENHFGHWRYANIYNERVSLIHEMICRRKGEVERRAVLHKQLNDGRRRLRAELKNLHEELISLGHKDSGIIGKMSTYGLIAEAEKRRISEILNNIQIEHASERCGQEIIELIDDNREVKANIIDANAKLEMINQQLALAIRNLCNITDLPHDIREHLSTILVIIERTEQEHRLTQVRHKIAATVLTSAL